MEVRGELFFYRDADVPVSTEADEGDRGGGATWGEGLRLY